MLHVGVEGFTFIVERLRVEGFRLYSLYAAVER